MTLPAQTVHHIPGRLRLQVDQPLVFNGHRPGFEATLRELPAVTNVRLNPTCQSVVLDYDPARTSGEVLAAQVGQLSLERLASPASAPAEEEDESSWVSLALAAGALVLGAPLAPWLMGAAAVPIFRRAYDAFVERGRPNVDALDASATLALLLQGQVQTASLMVLLVALGHAIADYTLYQSRRALEGLYDGTGELAWVVRRGRTCRVRVEEIQPGEQVVVYPGELIPVDGTVAAGTATVDQTALTGESLPVAKAPGSEVLAATVVREGKLYVTATKIGQQTRAARIVRLVREAPIRETRIQNYAEQFADDLVPWTFAGAGALMGLGNMQGASSVLIVDYATGIRIAAPTAVLSSMARAARQGILIKGGRTLERLAAVDAIVFDKTGTLTLGTQEIIEVVPYGAGRSADRVLAFAAAAEQRLTHPVAVAIVGTARARRLRIPARKSSEYQIGMGVKAQVNGNTVLVGAVRFLEAHGVPVDRAAADLAEAERRAASPVLVAVDGELAGLLLYVDPVRPEAAEVVSALREGGIHELVMLTGDSRAVAAKVAADLGLTRYVAEALPDQKMALVRELQAQGKTVAVVGDGINDSPALAQADVGIAVHGGADVARETAHVALLQGTLSAIPTTFRIAREAADLIQQSWTLNFYPNSAAIGLTLLGLTGPVGTTLISNGAGILAALNGLRPLLPASPVR